MQCKNCDCKMNIIAHGIYLCSCGYIMEINNQNEWRPSDLIVRMDKKIPGLKDVILSFLKQKSFQLR